MSLGTLLLELYCIIDDWCKLYDPSSKGPRVGRPPRMSNAEILTLAIISQWRAGVPWQSERGMMRYMHAYGKQWFPDLISREAFNIRMRKLTPLLVGLQQHLADELIDGVPLYEVVDCTPVRQCSLSHSLRHLQHWIPGNKGKGGTDGGWFFGSQILLCVSDKGVITGWMWAPANVDDRYVLQAFLSSRAGDMNLEEPPVSQQQRNRLRNVATTEAYGPPMTAGISRGVPAIADAGFNGARWLNHWWQQFKTAIIAPVATNKPKKKRSAWQRSLASKRQIVETVIARLCETFGFKRINAHSETGLIARLSAIMAGYNLGMLINIQEGRKPGAHATLIC